METPVVAGEKEKKEAALVKSLERLKPSLRRVPALKPFFLCTRDGRPRSRWTPGGWHVHKWTNAQSPRVGGF